MLISIPPKFAVSSVIGHVKGRSAIHVAQHFLGKERNHAGQSLWARGFFVSVSTAGVNDEIIREYIRIALSRGPCSGISAFHGFRLQIPGGSAIFAGKAWMIAPWRAAASWKEAFIPCRPERKAQKENAAALLKTA